MYYNDEGKGFVYLNNKILFLVIHEGYEGGYTAEKIHKPHLWVM